MNIHKINTILQAMSSDECKQFGKTLKGKTILERLFNYLKNPKKNVDDTDKMASYVFKEHSRVNLQKDLHSKASDLYKLLQKWLIQQELKADELTQNQLLSKALKRYKATDAYFETLNKREHLIEKQPTRDSAYHWSQMRLAHARYFNPQTDFSSEMAEENFTKTVQHLDDFYLLTRLRYIAERNMRNYNFDLHGTLTKQEEMLRPSYKKKPLVQLCMLAAKLIQSPDNEIFRTKFSPLMEDYIHLTDPENQGTLATYRINYTSKQTQKGHADFMHDQFAAYKFAIENGYLENEGYLDETHFLNAVTTVAVLQEPKGGKELIEEAANRLQNDSKDIREFANAVVLFYQLDYAECYEKLRDRKFTNIQTDLRYRSLMAQCMYQLILQDADAPDADDLIKHLDAYQKFLQRRDKFSTTTRQSNLNFTNLLKKMANKPKKEAKILLENFLKTDQPIILKTWLSDVVNK